ncbi:MULTISPECIES: GNAT family N-acetyltransferase [Mumia]|uniref:GNAT family N-acetyltransferase n=1 Tax=Mumia xiangluensis TaxID=1678900 RepID=A0ABW1QGN0_9ACTN|nr:MULTISPECIES: GNAT family N-acetyltransferase [Mumia]
MRSPTQPGLVVPTADDAPLVASWSRSADEARRWCSTVEHPFDPDRVRRWWNDDDVRPWLLVEDTAPVAYGEVWVDHDEDEGEIARVLVDPAARGRGVGRALATLLVADARDQGLAACFVRVIPDNGAALAAYRSAGFVDVDPARTAEWNAPQPVPYVWLEHLGD